MAWYNGPYLYSEVFPHIKFMVVFSFYLWRLYGAGYVSWISPLYYVFNNMLFTACEWSDWTYGGSFHSHLWRSMWSQVHKCKFATENGNQTWSSWREVSRQISKIESLSLNVQFMAGITGTLSDFCNDIKQQTRANWIWVSGNKGTHSEPSANMWIQVLN